MLIVLIRHAERETRPERRELEQTLTRKGHEDAARLAQRIAARLKADNVTISQVLSSSYMRTIQTAGHVAKELGLEDINALDILQPAPDGSVNDTIGAVKEAAQKGNIIVVGHGPDLAQLCRYLSGEATELQKAHALAINWDATTYRGSVAWQLDPG